jgi:hypothetical protein
MSARLIACVVLFAAAALVGSMTVDRVAAQGKDNKGGGNALDKQLRAAQNDLQTAQRQVAALRDQVSQLSADNNKL